LSRVGETGLANGNPPALTRLRDGRLCCVYGDRTREVMLARLSADEGSTWEPEQVLREGFQRDCVKDWSDFGYPQTVQRSDGKVVAIYYWASEDHPQQHLEATVWDP
jgi:hypothetical protein